MAGTRRHTFGNLVGHVKGVSDMNSLASWTNEQFDPRLSWADVAWVKEKWGGKLILKGIQDVEDARLAVQSGADAIVVSNHGGRQLDGAPSSISALPEIVEAVGSSIEVWMDGAVICQYKTAKRSGREFHPLRRGLRSDQALAQHDAGFRNAEQGRVLRPRHGQHPLRQ